MEISFEPIKVVDCGLLHEWLQLEHVLQFWNDGDRSLTQVIKHYARDDNIKRYIFYIDKKAVGYIQSYYADTARQYMQQANLNEAIGVDFFIGNIAYLNKGYASTILKAFITKHCLGLKNIIVDPAVSNLKAIHIYEKVGFIKSIEFYENNILHQLMVKSLKNKTV